MVAQVRKNKNMDIFADKKTVEAMGTSTISTKPPLDHFPQPHPKENASPAVPSAEVQVRKTM
jgi:hypothetical protein